MLRGKGINNFVSRVVSIGESKFKIFNLTEPLRLDCEVYPGDPKPEKKVFCTFDKNNSQHNIYSLGDHVFHPHGDAPGHQNRELKNRGFEFWDMNYVFNSACMIDLSNSKDAKKNNGIKFLTKVCDYHILPYLNIMREVGAVIIRTGYDKWIEKNKKHNPELIPYLNKSAANIIAGLKSIKVFGIDSITIDHPGDNYTHREFKNLMIVESLVKLYNIPKKFRNSFTLQTSPIAIIGATGGPVSAYAYVKE